tara:strand:- start:1665 stop:1790 length:126 start_codon:yes stop_codon:yes gene_type:complete
LKYLRIQFDITIEEIVMEFSIDVIEETEATVEVACNSVGCP